MKSLTLLWNILGIYLNHVSIGEEYLSLAVSDWCTIMRLKIEKEKRKKKALKRVEVGYVG